MIVHRYLAREAMHEGNMIYANKRPIILHNTRGDSTANGGKRSEPENVLLM